MSWNDRIESDSTPELVAALIQLPEEERPALATLALERYQLRRSEVQGAFANLSLALLASASLTQLQKVRLLFAEEEAALAVLRARRPPWLAEYCRQLLPWHWHLVRQLQQEGLVPQSQPEDEGFWLALITSPRRKNALEVLRADPELWPHLPALFRHEGQGENSLAAYDKYVSAKAGWAFALASLIESGNLSRPLYLRLSLEALGRDFEAFRAGWFGRFHEQLKPTQAERKILQPEYARLLSSRVRPTVKLALKALLHLPQTEGVETEAVTPALLSQDKSSALLAVKLIDRIDPNSRELAQALASPHAEVQTAALRLLRKGSFGSTAWLLEWGDSIHPTLRSEWHEWMGEARPSTSAETILEVEADLPVLPCQSLDEVIQLSAQLLEKAEPAWDIERLLDGWLRFPAPAGSLLGPLRKRAKTRSARSDLEGQLARLCQLWLDPSSHWSEGGQPRNGLEHLWWRRRQSWVEQLRSGGGQGLADLPDFRSGRIERKGTFGWRSGGEPPDPEWHWRVDEESYQRFVHRSLVVQLEQSHPLFEGKPSEQAEERRWQATFCPTERERWFLFGLSAIANNLDWWEANWADRVFLEGLLTTAYPGRAGRWLMAFGLACKQSEQTALAVEAMLRCQHPAQLLGQTLAEVAHTKMISPARWTKSLTQVAQLRPNWIFDVLVTLVEQSPENFDLAPLLPLLHEVQCRCDKSCQLERLARWPGRGKAASLAAKITLLKPTGYDN